jgi:hypothetical protein
MIQANGILRLPENDWEMVGRAFLHYDLLANTCRVEEIVNSVGEQRLSEVRREVELAVNYPELYVMSPVGAELEPVKQTSHHSPAQLSHEMYSTLGETLFEGCRLHRRSDGERVGEEIRVLHHTKVAYPPYKDSAKPEVETTPSGTGDIMHTGDNARGNNRAVRWVKFEGKVYFFSNPSAMLSPQMLNRINEVTEQSYADHKRGVTEGYKALSNWVNRFKHMAAVEEDFTRMKLSHGEVMLQALKSPLIAEWDLIGNTRLLKWLKHDGMVYVFCPVKEELKPSEIAFFTDHLSNSQTMEEARHCAHRVFQRVRGTDSERHQLSRKFHHDAMVYA